MRGGGDENGHGGGGCFLWIPGFNLLERSCITPLTQSTNLFFFAGQLAKKKKRLIELYFYINIHYHDHSCNKKPHGPNPKCRALSLNARAHIQQVWLYKSRATALRQHFNFLAFLRCKESLSLLPSRSPASRHSRDIRDKLVCHSLVIFTIRLKLPGRSHQNPIGPYREKNTHGPAGLSKGNLKNIELTRLCMMVWAHRRKLVFIFSFFLCFFSPCIMLQAAGWLCVRLLAWRIDSCRNIPCRI